MMWIAPVLATAGVLYLALSRPAALAAISPGERISPSVISRPVASSTLFHESPTTMPSSGAPACRAASAAAITFSKLCRPRMGASEAAISGAPLPRNAAEDSYNLLPALTGKPTQPIREAIVHHSIDGMFSIRQGKWKLELGLGSGGFTPPARIPPKW